MLTTNPTATPDNTDPLKTTANEEKNVEKHPILLHMAYNQEGSMCPFKVSGWTLVLVVLVVACCMCAYRWKKAPPAVTGGAAPVTVRTVAPSANELLSDLSSF